jgi:hypothetical protein
VRRLIDRLTGLNKRYRRPAAHDEPVGKSAKSIGQTGITARRVGVVSRGHPFQSSAQTVSAIARKLAMMEAQARR